MTLKGRRFSPTKGIHLPRKDYAEAGLGMEKCWMKTKLKGSTSTLILSASGIFNLLIKDIK